MIKITVSYDELGFNPEDSHNKDWEFISGYLPGIIGCAIPKKNSIEWDNTNNEVSILLL